MLNRLKLLKRNITLYRLILVFGRNGLLTSGLYFFFTLNKALSPSQTLFLISLALIVGALAEVPTGVVADKYSRKISVLAGYFVLLSSWMAVLYFGEFWQLILVTIIKGVGGSLISGADDALLYDTLQEGGQTSKYKEIYNKSKSIELVAFAVTILIGGFLASISLILPIFLHLLLTSISIILAALMLEPDRTDDASDLAQTGYISITKQSFQMVFSRTSVQSGLLAIFLSSALIAAVFKSTKYLVAPFLDSFGSDVLEVSLVIAIMIFIKAAGAYIASRFNKAGGERREVFISLLVFVVSLIVIVVTKNLIITILLFVLITGLDNLILTNLSSLLHEQIKSSNRSTVLSMLSLFSRSTEMLYLTSFGWILELYSPTTALLLTSVWLGVVLLIFGLSNIRHLRNLDKHFPKYTE